jgi:hypothetical protein
LSSVLDIAAGLYSPLAGGVRAAIPPPIRREEAKTPRLTLTRVFIGVSFTFT